MHCSPEELRSDIVVEYSEEIMGQLRTELASDIKKMTEITLTRSLKYERFDVDIKKYYQSDKEKKGREQYCRQRLICYFIKNKKEVKSA